jgi:hypothetical protein
MPPKATDPFSPPKPRRDYTSNNPKTIANRKYIEEKKGLELSDHRVDAAFRVAKCRMLKKLHEKPGWGSLTDEKKARLEQKAVEDLLAKRDAQKRKNEITYNVKWERGELDAEEQGKMALEDTMNEAMDWEATEGDSVGAPPEAVPSKGFVIDSTAGSKRKKKSRRTVEKNQAPRETDSFSPTETPMGTASRKRRFSSEDPIAGKKRAKREEAVVSKDDGDGWVTEPDEIIVTDLWSAKDKLCRDFVSQIANLEPKAKAANDEFMKALLGD